MLDPNTIQSLLENTSENLLSLYLHVDAGYQPNQSNQPAWQIYLKNALSDLENQNNNNIDWSSVKTHTQEFVEGYSPQSKSLVLFVNEEGVISHFDLPVAVKNYHAIGEIDLVPLLWAIDEYEQYLVVLVDSEQARFVSASLGGASTNEEMTIDFDDYDFGNKQFIHANHGDGIDGQQGSGGDNFADMKDEHIRRFHKDVAEQIREVMGDIQAERIVLAGSEQSAHQVKSLLHDSVQAQVVDILAIPMDSNDSDIASQISQTALNFERSSELDLVNEIIDFAKSGGRGALGLDAVQKALDMQQVDLLILPYPMDDEDLASELTLKALKSGASIELVHGSASDKLATEGTFGARLYYSINETQNA
ncbi:MAG: hypothetical protein Phog2KO_31350 [Phototrophicaceae bacterium]